ncbi:MAG: hypothetical protein GXP24_02840 [Planctomycetes bacterium]|nr:hypothetical protein [Planctomycetota bacterium]
MALTFDPISSPGATRDLFVDLSGVLEESEILTQASVTSAYLAVLVTSNVSLNSEVVEFGELQIAAGKGVHFTIETVAESQATVPLFVSFEGDSGTVDKYEIAQPVVVSLCR